MGGMVFVLTLSSHIVIGHRVAPLCCEHAKQEADARQQSSDGSRCTIQSGAGSEYGYPVFHIHAIVQSQQGSNTYLPSSTPSLMAAIISLII